MKLNLVFDIEPLTMNMAYPTGRNGVRHLSAKGKVYHRYISIITRLSLSKTNFKFNSKIHYSSMGIEFYSPCFKTKKNEISKIKPDTSNCIKLLEDAIFETIGVDDYLNIDFDYIRFRYAEKPRIIVEITIHNQEELFKIRQTE